MVCSFRLRESAQACGYGAGVEKGVSDGERRSSEARVVSAEARKTASGAHVGVVVVEVGCKSVEGVELVVKVGAEVVCEHGGLRSVKVEGLRSRARSRAGRALSGVVSTRTG
jgi:hypothetical protein